MGSGKTTIGKIVAAFLNRPFTDTDLLIEVKTGKKVSEIFRRKGEAFFRREESLILIALQNAPAGVIAVGGGMVLSPFNREILRRGIWFHLKVSVPVILSRIGNATGRPLLKKGTKRDEVERLLRSRGPLYDLAPNQIDTDGLAPDTVAEAIAQKIRRGNFR